MKNLVAVVLLLILASGSLVAQEAKKKQTGNLLAYVPKEVRQFTVFRPAKMLRDKDVLEFRSLAGKSFERYADRLLNRYLKFGLVDLRDIDAIVDASWIEQREGQSWSHHSIMVLRTEHPSRDKFDLATHAVKSESEYKGKTILAMKVALDGRYRHACILNERTIAWSRTKEALKQSIDAGKTGPAKSDFYAAWKPFADDNASLFVKFDRFGLASVQPPFSDLKDKLQWMVGCAELGKTTKAKMIAKFDSTKSAVAAEEKSDEYLKFIQNGLQRQKIANSQQEVGAKIILDMLASTKVKQAKDLVKADASVKLDLKKLVGPLNEAFMQSKRVEAANNIRQNALALHNYASAFGGLPPSVFTHKESGKTYSWRIAILPFVERQDLYDRYDFIQEWDSPHNLEVTSEMPDFFRSDSDDVDSTNTSFFMLTGPGGVLGQEEMTQFEDMADGSSNTMMLIEAKRQVHWSKPEDILIDPENPLPDFGGFHEGGFNVTMADGSVHFVPENVAENLLRAYFSPAGGEIPQPLEVPQDSGEDTELQGGK